MPRSERLEQFPIRSLAKQSLVCHFALGSLDGVR